MEIRKATSDDRKELAILMEQLDYQITIEQMRIRFHVIEASPNHLLFIACYKKKVVGMVVFHFIIKMLFMFESLPM